MILPNKLICILLLCTAVLLLTACGEKDLPGGAGFDRSGLLQNYADALIVPSYSTLSASMEDLQSAITDFVGSPELATLITARNQWRLTYENWQSANAYNFGPAAEAGEQMDLLQEIGTFPIDAALVENNIASSQTDLNSVERDARGFLTIEYLLYGPDGDMVTTIALFAEDSNRNDYLLATVANVKQRIQTTLSEWQIYKSAFIANDGTDAGSSVSQLYNEFVRSFEAAKNFKVGLPAGKRPGQLETEPQLVEALYSGQSLPMLSAHLNNLDRIYQGGNGLGFADYLASVEGGADLVSLTEEQWDAVMQALAEVPTDRPFAELIAENHPSVDALHTELQRHTRFFKSDMSSLLGIAITFASGDGD